MQVKPLKTCYRSLASRPISPIAFCLGRLTPLRRLCCIFRKIKHNAQTWKDPGHWRQIANISVHAPEQGGYRRLVGRDRIQVTHCGFRCRPSGRPRRPHKELGILKMADLRARCHDTLLAAVCSNDRIMMPSRIFRAELRTFRSVSSGIGDRLYVTIRSASSL